MQFIEFEESIKPVVYHNELNPKLWNGTSLDIEVRYKLMAIAMHFAKFLNVSKLNLRDITISGSNASFGYTNDQDVKSKARNYSAKINAAMRSNDLNTCKETMAEIRRLRQSGLEKGGEHSVENLAFKLLRARGKVDKFRKFINKLQSAELSLGEER